MTTTRLCPQCHAPILGRNDKKFCSDDCRSLANNEKRRSARLPTKSINDTLWKNREILRSLWKERPTIATRDMLLNLGYHFGYYTTQHATSNSPYYACYDFGFQPRMNSGIKIALVVKMLKLSEKDPWD